MAKIEAKMARAYQEEHRKVFWAHQFEDQKEVDSTWQRMAAEGKIRFRASVYCQDGHEAWGGAAELVPKKVHVCLECPTQSEEIETSTEIRAVLTDDWCKTLDETSVRESGTR